LVWTPDRIIQDSYLFRKKIEENLGFEDCEDVDPTQTPHLTTEDLKSAEPIQAQSFEVPTRQESDSLY
jgi:hypothetical protein